VPAGEYVLKQKWPGFVIYFGKYDIETKVAWAPRQTYYYQLEIWLEFMATAWRLSPMKPEQGSVEIQQCRFQTAFGQQKVLDELKRKDGL
jgi:hypothetical protein